MRDDLALVARHDRLEHVVPAVSAVHVPGTQSTAFEVAKLVEHEQRVIAGAGVMAFQTLISCSPWVGLTLESMSSTMPRGGLRPCTRSIHWPDRSARAAKFSGEPLRLEAPHLTRRSRAALRRFAADNPAHSRIVAQALGVVHILVSGKTTKYRLPEQPGQCVPTILATACVGQNITRHLGQTEYVVEFTISQQPSIGGHQGAAKLEHQAAV